MLYAHRAGLSYGALPFFFQTLNIQLTMKTLLITALAAACTALAQQSIETQIDPEATRDNFNICGWTQSLTNSYMTQSDLDTSVLYTLNSISIKERNNNSSSMKIAVFENTSSNSLTLGNLVGVSSACSATTTTNTFTSFDFSSSSITLDLNKNYAFIFVTADSNITSADDISIGNGINAPLSQRGVKVVNGSELDLSKITGSSGYVNNYGNYVNDYTAWLPDVKFEITKTDTPTSPAVPEPATATLSLLALAGLAARRRRK